MIQKKLPIILLALVLYFPSENSHAETIVLTSGKTITDKIIERTDRYIKIELQGIPITYFLDEIVSINGKNAVASKQEDKSGPLDDDEKIKIVKELLDVSGIKQQLDNIPASVEAPWEKGKADVGSEIADLVGRVIKDACKPDRIYQLISNNFLKNFDKDHFLKILSWHHSSLAQKIIQLEVKSSTPGAEEKERQFGINLQSNPASDDRIDLIQRLDAATDMVDSSLEIQISLGLKIMRVFQIASPEPHPITQNDWEEQYKSFMKAKLEPTAKQHHFNSMLYTYNTLSDKDLEQYVNFNESDDGKWFNKIMKQAHLDAMDQIGDDIAQKLLDVLPQLKRMYQEQDDGDDQKDAK